MVRYTTVYIVVSSKGRSFLANEWVIRNRTPASFETPFHSFSESFWTRCWLLYHDLGLGGLPFFFGLESDGLAVFYFKQNRPSLSWPTHYFESLLHEVGYAKHTSQNILLSVNLTHGKAFVQLTENYRQRLSSSICVLPRLGKSWFGTLSSPSLTTTNCVMANCVMANCVKLCEATVLTPPCSTAHRTPAISLNFQGPLPRPIMATHASCANSARIPNGSWQNVMDPQIH